MKKQTQDSPSAPGVRPPVVLAAAAHPDDIEFMMAGTLLRLKDAGAQIHLWHLANGCHGTAVHGHDEIVRIRGEEGRAEVARALPALREAASPWQVRATLRPEAEAEAFL